MASQCNKAMNSQLFIKFVYFNSCHILSHISLYYSFLFKQLSFAFMLHDIMFGSKTTTGTCFFSSHFHSLSWFWALRQALVFGVCGLDTIKKTSLGHFYSKETSQARTTCIIWMGQNFQQLHNSTVNVYNFPGINIDGTSVAKCSSQCPVVSVRVLIKNGLLQRK